MSNRFSLAEEHASFSAPFICKMSFYAPKKVGNVNQQKNAKHIDYIGNRPGVDRGEEERELPEGEFDLQEELHTWREKEFDPDTPMWHVKYANERPGSTGLFSWSDSKPNVKEIKNELLEHKGIVWRTVLSLSEEDANRLGFTARSKWEDSVRASVTDAASKMGISETNLRWVAAFHQEKHHPHVHLVMWEKKPLRRKGAVNSHQLSDIKRSFAKEIYAEERMLLNQEKTAMRELVRNMSKDELSNIVNIMREVKDYTKEIELNHRSIGDLNVGIAPKLYSDDQLDIMNRVKMIGEMLPDKGRIAYQYMPDQVKSAVNETSKWFLKQPAFQESLRRYYGAVENMTKQYSFKESDIRKAKDNAAADLEKRVSQVVLRAAVEAKKKIYTTVDPERAQFVVNQFAQAMGRPEDDFSKQLFSKVIDSLRQVGVPVNEQLQLTKEWLKQADLQLPLDEAQSIIQRVNHSAPEEIDKANQVAANVMKLAGYSDDQVKFHFKTVGSPMPDLKQSRKAMKESVQKISEKDWTKFIENTGIKAEYPWELKREQVVVSDVEEIVEKFREGKISASLEDQQSKGYTAYCMTVALKQLGIGDNERKEVMKEFARNNSVEGMNRILKSISEAETSFLKDETWKKINDAIDTDIAYPWRLQETLQVSPEKYEEAIRAISLSAKTVDEDSAQWTAQKYAALLREGTSNEQEIVAAVKEWAQRTGSLDKDQIHANDILEKRTNDMNVLGRQLKVTDEVQKTISNFAKVMFGSGLNHEEVVKMISDWNLRSGLNVSEERLENIIDRVNKEVEDLKPWGRAPVVGKRDYDNLKKTLEVDAPYLWSNQKDRSQGPRRGQDPSMNIAKSLWKSVWSSMEQERMKSQAQGEMMKKQNEKRLQREAEREQE